MKVRDNIFPLILVFVLAALPMAATFTLFYPDERHYLDGGLTMARDGDWLIPKHADGTPRFEKTWSLARRLTGSRERALLAAVVLLSQAQFYLCAVRSIPDAWLTFFITLSASGFIRLIVLEEGAPAVFWMAYGGAAGAVLSKGLLGAGVVGFAWGFTLWTRREPGLFKRLLHWPSLLVSAALSLSWFIYIWYRYGNSSLDTFFDDQVTSNLHGHWWDPAIRLGEYALVLVANFLPWSLPAIELLVRRRFRLSPQLPGRSQAFLLGWAALLMFGFPLGENVSPRYLLPAAPLMAILLADWLPDADTARCWFSPRRLLAVILVLLAALTLAGGYFVAQWPQAPFNPWLLFGAIMVLIAALGWLVRRGHLPAIQGLGLSLLLAWLIFFAANTPLYWREIAHQIASALRDTPGSEPKTVLVVGQRQLASRLRTVLSRDWSVAQVDELNAAAVPDCHFLVGADLALRQLPPQPVWQYETVGFIPAFPSGGQFWQGLRSGQLPTVIEQAGKKISIAVRLSPGGF